MDWEDSEDRGNICFSLQDEWNDSQNGLEDIINGLLFLLNYPNLRDPWVSFMDASMSRRVLKRRVRQSLAGMSVSGCSLEFKKFVEYDKSLDKYHSDLESEFEDEGDDKEGAEDRYQGYFFNGGEERSNLIDLKKVMEETTGAGGDESGCSSKDENPGGRTEGAVDGGTSIASNVQEKHQELNENPSTENNDHLSTSSKLQEQLMTVKETGSNAPGIPDEKIEEKISSEMGLSDSGASDRPRESGHHEGRADLCDLSTQVTQHVNNTESGVEDEPTQRTEVDLEVNPRNNEQKPLDINNMLVKIQSIIDTLKPEDFLDENGKKLSLHQDDECQLKVGPENNSNEVASGTGETPVHTETSGDENIRTPPSPKPSLSRQSTEKLEDILTASPGSSSLVTNPTRSGSKRCMSLEMMLKTSPPNCLSSFVALSRQETESCKRLSLYTSNKRHSSQPSSAEPPLKMRRMNSSFTGGITACVDDNDFGQCMMAGCSEYQAMVESQKEKSNVDVSSIIDRYKDAKFL